MVERVISKVIKKYAKEYPIIAIVGPRQSGKTTRVLYFWRDKTGNEIDLLVDFGVKTIPIEIKSSSTYNSSFSNSIEKWFGLKGNTNEEGFILYQGRDIIGKKAKITIAPWYAY